VQRRPRVAKMACFLVEEHKKMGEHAKRGTHHIRDLSSNKGHDMIRSRPAARASSNCGPTR